MSYIELTDCKEQKLFVFYLGGKVKGCNIEMHDVVFVVGHSNKDILQKVKNKWCGTKESLHIDSWFILENIDGFDIKIVDKIPSDSEYSLYFVNLGSYKEGQFGENHFMGFYIAKSKSQAIKIAKSDVLKDQIIIHSDNIYDIDDCLNIDNIDNKYIALQYSGNKTSINPVNGYQKIPSI